MAKTIQRIAVVVFIISIVVLTFLAVSAIWDVFDDDILYKSLSTMGVISFASLVVIIAAKVIDKNHNDGGPSGGPNIDM